MLIIKQLAVLNDNYIYLLHEPKSKQTAVVDPALAAPVLSALRTNHWSLTYILNTHHHQDHVGGNMELKTKTHCHIAGATSDKTRIPGIDILLTEKDTLTLGNYRIEIIECSGHTLGHIAFYIPAAKALFCGDTLFAMGCGRLFEGSAEQMHQTLQKIAQLPPETKLYCAHEYTENNALFALSVDAHNHVLQETYQQVKALRRKQQSTVPTTLKQELATNPFLRCDNIAIKTHLGMMSASPLAVFSQLRALKNTF